MQTESSVGDVSNEVMRFRILCVGRSGVGKSSLINRVFGIDTASVEHWKLGETQIEKELTSAENRLLVLHDSNGFEVGYTKPFDIMNKFIKQRRNESLPLKDQLHAIWLCTEIPIGGRRMLDTSDEKLIQLAHETHTPLVVVFTKYDNLLRAKKAELREDNNDLNPADLDIRSKEEAQKDFDTRVQSLGRTLRWMGIPMPRHARASVYPGYEADIASLVWTTGELIYEQLQGDAWMMWVAAQRASVALKIEACAATAMVYLRRSDNFAMGTLLRDRLAEVHQDIVTCWSFRDEDHILSSDGFKRLMLYLVQDLLEPEDQDTRHLTPPPTINKISQFINAASPPISPPMAALGMSDISEKCLSSIFDNSPKFRRIFVTYTVDLTAVLRSLLDILIETRPPSGRTTWSKLKDAFEAYEGSRQRIHHRICETFQQDQQILDPDHFNSVFCDLVNDGGQDTGVSAPPVPAPVPTSAPAEPPSDHGLFSCFPCLRMPS